MIHEIFPANIHPVSYVIHAFSLKSKFGANAILGISMAVMKASAKNKGIPLYQYIGNGKTLPKPMETSHSALEPKQMETANSPKNQAMQK